MADEKKIILEVQNLTKYFDTPKGKLHAVDGVSFQIEEGKTLGALWVRAAAASPRLAAHC